MVDILPFNGLIYNKETVTDISSVISPPYDIISSKKRKALLTSNPYNIVNLILPRDISGKNKYELAKNILQDWTNKNILKTDSEKCFYIIEEDFYIKGRKRSITGFIGLTKIEPYHTKKIIRHEKTLSKPKQDRLNLLRSCRTNFGLVYTLYSDPQKKIYSILNTETGKKPFIDITAGYDKTLKFKLWRTSSANAVEKIIDPMKEKTLIIADGHHRYETSLIYKNETILNNSADESCFMPENYVLTLYVDSSQEGISIFPTYRIVKFKAYPGYKKILQTINDYFHVENLDTGSDNFINKKLQNSSSKGEKSFLIYFKEKEFYFLTLKSGVNKIPPYSKKVDYKYENLYVNILHKFLLNKLEPEYGIEKIKYSCSIEEVKENINSNNFDMGIILNSVTLKELEKISSAGKLMPQKSTFFYPKPCTGLVMYKFDSTRIQNLKGDI